MAFGGGGGRFGNVCETKETTWVHFMYSYKCLEGAFKVPIICYKTYYNKNGIYFQLKIIFFRLFLESPPFSAGLK